MFFLWVRINKIATKTEKIIKVWFSFFNARFKIIGKLTPAIIDDKETYFEIINTAKNTTSTHALVIGVKQITTPNNVATPFPPLNPAKTGKTCPTNAATPKPNCKLTNWSLSNANGDKNANKTAKAPLIISIVKTGIPAFLPNTLKVLVAPAFPLPNSRTSIP